MTADTVGGVWTYSLELARALRPYGVQIALATMGALPSSEQQAELRDIGNVRIFASTFKLEWMDDPWDDVQRAGDWLLRLERVVQPDVVHLNSYAHGALPWMAPALIVGHSCVMSWWYAVRGECAPGCWNHYSHEAARGLHAVRLVVAPTRHMLASLERHYGHVGVARVIPNGRTAHVFRPAKKEPFVFTAGRVWDEAKNVAALAQAAGDLPWPVYVAGEDEHPNGGSLHYDNVRMLGRLAPQAVPYWFARAAIYALPARYEPFGISTLEAGLARCALVLGDIPTLREVWGDAAVFVPPDDSDALRSAVRELIDDAPRRRLMGSRARRRALEFAPERMASSYMEAYRGLIDLFAYAEQPSSRNGQSKPDEPELQPLPDSFWGGGS